MKTLAFIILILLFTAGIPGRAADDDNTPKITVEVSGIGMTNNQAMLLFSRYNAQWTAAEEVKEALAMVKQKNAENMGSLLVTTVSGQNATAESGPSKLEVEAVKDPASDHVDLNIDFTCLKKRIATAIFAKSGDVKCIGALDFASDAGRSGTCLVFIQVTVGK